MFWSYPLRSGLEDEKEIVSSLNYINHYRLYELQSIIHFMHYLNSDRPCKLANQYNLREAVLQIRRGNRDNFGIISHISP